VKARSDFPIIPPFELITEARTDEAADGVAVELPETVSDVVAFDAGP
jgi:hypothetical protein